MDLFVLICFAPGLLLTIQDTGELQRIGYIWLFGCSFLYLIRLLIDTFDPSGWQYDVPEIDVLVKGIKDATQRVTYLTDDARANYPGFRKKLDQLLDSGFLDESKASVLRQEVQLFDEAIWSRKQRRSDNSRSE